MSAKPPQALTALPLKCRDDSVKITSNQVKYDVVASYSKLMELVK